MDHKKVEKVYLAQTCVVLALTLALSYFNVRYYLFHRVLRLHHREFHVFMFAILQSAFTFLAASCCL